MRIGRVVALHTLAAALGALLLTAVLGLRFVALDRQQRRFGTESAVERDLFRLEDSVRSWLVTNDLVYGSGETLLASGSRRQAESVRRLASEIAAEPLGTAAAAPLGALSQLVSRDEKRLAGADRLTIEEASAQFEAILVSWDADAQAAPSLLDETRQLVAATVQRHADELQRQRERIRALAATSAGAYAALVAFSWLWVTRSFVRPIEQLTSVAERASRSGERVELAEAGPTEVRNLTRSVRTFVNELEDLVRERTAEAREAQARAEASSLAKSEFLARMSHEIRTPLNGVLGIAELLEELQSDPRARALLGTLHSSGRQLLGIVNDVLDYSKVEAGAIALRRAPFPLADAVHQTVAAHASEAARRGLDLRVSLAPGLPSSVVGDELRVRQVLTNLLGNAIKFTQAGEVTLSVEEAPPEYLRFGVRDSGIGIAPEDQARIFDRFSQVETSATRRFGGTGLGLAISQRLAALMDGEIHMESKLGQGSTFWFSLPLSRAEEVVLSARASAPVKTESAAAAGPRLAVLVVEDDPVNQLVIVAMLEALACRVSACSDGASGVREIAAQRFDLVLMDLHMPGLDGLAATRTVREQERATGAPATRIAALTASVLEDDRRACFDAGMNDYGTKPASKEQLAELLERARMAQRAA